ncbi:MAG: dihydropteroate synthase [Fibrobacter sp.]|nr:dihydropteroate synthase [Fibrobacter sp.]
MNNEIKVPFRIMGVVNVTPDSFYDGGKHDTTVSAVEHSLRLAEQGADILDIGGASSRPGASPVPQEEEKRRILPVIKEVAARFSGPISVDTTWSGVAEAALDAGASWINDISAGRADPEMIRLAARRKCTMVLMHSRGTPETMQINPGYDDVVSEVREELLDACRKFIEGGVSRDKIILDPGIGFAFAKTAEHNLALLRGLDKIAELGYPVLLGTSRKRFIGQITGKEVQDRLCGTLATVAAGYLRGSRIFRVHDVDETRDFLKVLAVIEKGLPVEYFS